MTIPPQVRKLIDELVPTDAPPRANLADLRRGDLVNFSATPPSGELLVGVVTWIDQKEQMIGVHVAEIDIDYATDLDLIVTSEQSETPFRVLIEAEIYGPIFSEQLVSLLGRIPLAMVDGVTKSLKSDGESVEKFNHGLPLGGPDDPRRLFKRDLFEKASAYMDTARRWLSGLGADIQLLDPSLLLPPLDGTPRIDGMEQGLKLIDALHQMRSEGAALPIELISALSEDELLDEIGRWKSEFGIDVLDVLTKISKTSAVVLTPLTEGPIDGREEFANSLDSMVAMCVRGGLPIIDIRSQRSLDNGGPGWRVETDSPSGKTSRVREKVCL